MAQRGYLGQQGRFHVLSRDKRLDRLDPCREGRLHEIFTFSDEEPELVAPAPVVQLPDELELLVLARGDQAASEPSADLAFSAIAPKACGSLTARSASTLRSSSISAFFKPATNWLYESPFARAAALIRMIQSRDRKSTRLNSSHGYISYAVFCL